VSSDRWLPISRLGLTVRRSAIVGFAAGAVAMGAWVVAMYPAVRGRPEFQDLLAKYPKEILAFFGGAANLDITSPTGYVRIELLSFMAPVLMLVMAIGLGAHGVAGQEEQGTLELVLARPVSRWRVVAEQALVVAAATGAVGAALLASLWVGTTATSMHVAVARLTAAAVAVTVLGFVYGMVALAVGAATGRRGTALGSAAALAAAAYLLTSLSQLIAGLEPLRPLSPFSQTVGLDPLGTGFHPLASLVMVGVGVAVGAAGALAFERRDVR